MDKKRQPLYIDEDGKEWSFISALSFSKIEDSEGVFYPSFQPLTVPINRFNYWYFWCICEKTNSGPKPVWLTKLSPKPWLTKERENFFAKIQSATIEEKFKLLVSLLKRHPEDMVNPEVGKVYNELFKNRDEETFRKYFKRTITTLKSGDRRGKTTKQKLVKLIERDMSWFEKILNRIENSTVEKAIDDIKVEVHSSEDSLWEVYKPYKKVYNSLLGALVTHTKVIHCMKIMGSNLDKNLATLDDKRFLLGVYAIIY